LPLVVELRINDDSKKLNRQFVIAAWAVVNIILMVMIRLGGDIEDLNNYIELALWTISIPAVLSSKKWGLALVIIVLVYTLSTSVGILIYYQIWLNAVRVAINIPAMIHLFKVLFEGKIK
jgi:hypothetical protein